MTQTGMLTSKASEHIHWDLKCKLLDKVLVRIWFKLVVYF